MMNMNQHISIHPNRTAKTVLLIVILALISALGIFAASGNTQNVHFTVGNSGYTIGSQSIPMDAATFEENGRTFVPVRYLAQALGVPSSGIQWDSATKTVTLTKGSTILKMVVGSTTLSVNNQPSSMDASPLIRSGRTFLPARYVATALGYSVSWDAASKTVILTEETAKAANLAVEIKSFMFTPETVTIHVGDTITWTNMDSASHTVTVDSADSSGLSTGQTFSHTFTKAGTYPTTCDFHSNMHGTVIVN